MNRYGITLTLLASCCALTLAAVTADDAPSSEKDVAAMMAEYMRTAKPVVEHDILKRFEGRWSTTTRMWLDPSMPPQSFDGAARGDLRYGGRFMFLESDGRCVSGPVTMLSIMGYDVYKKRFDVVVIGDGGTAMFSASGHVDPSGRRFESTGQMDDAIGNRPVRTVFRFDSPDRIFAEVFDTAGDQEIKVVEITYQRQKG